MAEAAEEGQPLEAEVELSRKAATKKEKVIAKRSKSLLLQISPQHLPAQELEVEVEGEAGEEEGEEKLIIQSLRNLANNATYLTLMMMTMFPKKARS